MIKKLFVICEVAAAGAALSSFYIYDANAQAPTPVICVSGCSAGSGTVNAQIIGTVPLPTGAATSANQTTQITILQGILTGVTGSVPSGTNTIGFISADPCSQATKTNIAISYVTTTSLQVVGLSTGKVIYVCSLSLIGSTATVFSLTTGTGTACATSAAAIMGAATATNGISLAANGGLTLGSGFGTIALSASGAELCIVQSGGGVIAGQFHRLYSPNRMMVSESELIAFDFLWCFHQEN